MSEKICWSFPDFRISGQCWSPDKSGSGCCRTKQLLHDLTLELLRVRPDGEEQFACEAQDVAHPLVREVVEVTECGGQKVSELRLRTKSISKFKEVFVNVIILKSPNFVWLRLIKWLFQSTWPYFATILVRAIIRENKYFKCKKRSILLRLTNFGDPKKESKALVWEPQPFPLHFNRKFMKLL